jgi:hypothetical protein
MDSQLLAMISIVRLARSFVLVPGVTGACDVVSVMPPNPVLPEFRAWALVQSLEARPPPCGRITHRLYLDTSQNCPQTTNFSYIKQHSTQS